MRSLLLIFGCLILSACGGSGGNASPSPRPDIPDTDPVVPVIDGAGFNLYLSANPLSGQATGMAITADQGSRITQVNWSQIAGPQVSLLANHTQAVGFDIPAAGNYQFRVTGILSNGQVFDQTLTFDAQQSAQPEASVRLDHSVTETGNVSLRADGDPNKTINEVAWTQSGGPRVIQYTEQDNLLFFDAPPVSSDSIIEFAATITYEDGSTSRDSAFIVVKDTNINSNGYFPSPDILDRVVTTDVFTYRSDSPYASALSDCIYNNLVDRSCPFTTLPLIGQVTESPQIDDILDRVLVSHQWMGDRFKQYLEQSIAASDMLKLFRATTAIVISYDIRPSFYWSATGAIYLDANNFWVEPQERDTLNDRPDYRSGFGNDLQFVIPWRYVKNQRNYLASGDYPASERLSKTFEDMQASITWLLYHELAHANDYFPPREWAQIPSSASPLSYTNGQAPDSDLFVQRFPLMSDTMGQLAQVSFFGQQATAQQAGYQPSDVTMFFEPDVAPAYYSYATAQEDYATLFERFMMLYRMDVSADVAVTSGQENDYLIAWGQRNRITDPRLQPRLREVIENILPELDFDAAVAPFPSPQSLPAGEPWRETLALPDPQGQNRTAKGKKLRDNGIIRQGIEHLYPTRPSTPF